MGDLKTTCTSHGWVSREGDRASSCPWCEIDRLRARVEERTNDGPQCEECGRDMTHFPCANDSEGAWECEACRGEARIAELEGVLREIERQSRVDDAMRESYPRTLLGIINRVADAALSATGEGGQSDYLPKLGDTFTVARKTYRIVSFGGEGNSGLATVEEDGLLRWRFAIPWKWIEVLRLGVGDVAQSTAAACWRICSACKCEKRFPAMFAYASLCLNCYHHGHRPPADARDTPTAEPEEPKPSPCLDPDKMHGAADGFGGSD